MPPPPIPLTYPEGQFENKLNKSNKMSKSKVYFAEGIVANKNLGLARPKVDIIDKPILEVNTNKDQAKRKFAFFVIDNGEQTATWGARVGDLMGLDKSPVTKDKDGVSIDPEGLFITLPVDPAMPISFRHGK
jgi:hypothetical protein